MIVALFLVYKRVEGYDYDSFDNKYVSGGRPGEFFLKFSPENWNPQSPGYIFDPTVEMDV